MSIILGSASCEGYEKTDFQVFRFYQRFLFAFRVVERMIIPYKKETVIAIVSFC